MAVTATRKRKTVEPLIVDSFAGGGGASLGIELALGRSPHIAINHDQAAITMHTANHPDTYHYTEDVWHVKPKVACAGRPVAFLWASPDCFTAGTLVVTPDGLIPIEQLRVGDLVLTHKNRWKPVVSAEFHEADCVSVRGQGHYGLVTTPSHQFYSKHITTRQPNRKKPNGKRVGPIRTLVENPYWPEAKAMSAKLWATPHVFPESSIPTCRGITFSKDFFYWLGRWLGDGSLNKGDAEICTGREDFPAMQGIFHRLPLRSGNGEVVEPRVTDRDTTQVLVWGNALLVAWLRENFGDSCETKHLPLWCLSMQHDWRFWLLEGYKAADGAKSNAPSSTKSVSKALSVGIRLLVTSLGYAASLYLCPGRPGQIDGREFMGADCYRVDWREDNQKQTTWKDSLHSFSRVKEVAPAGRQLVYSVQVADDESLVVDGIVVHNCRHFSRAKGGKPVKKNIRGLAWVVCRWAKDVRPPVLFLENVREFMDWGPLIQLKKGRHKQYNADGTPKLMPDPKRKGETFQRWRRYLQSLGYVLEHRVLNAADYGVPTSRKRLFIIARCDGKPIVWPEATHAKPDKELRVPVGMQPWRAAAECISWDLGCPSIFDPEERKAAGLKPQLAEKTMRRIAMGVMRYVLDNPHPFIVQTNHGGEDFRGQPTDTPLPTISSKHGYGIVDPFIARCAHGDQGNGKPRWGQSAHSMQEPLPTQTGSKDFAVVAPTLVSGYGERAGQAPRTQSVEDPLNTVVASGKHKLVASLLTRYYGQSIGQAVTEPGPTESSNGHTGLVAASITKIRGDSPGTAASDPLPTVTSGAGAARPAGAAHAMGLQAASLLRIGQYGGAGEYVNAATAPLPTIVSKNEHCLTAANLVQFNHGDKQWHGVEAPLNTVTAQGNHFGLVYALLLKYFGTSFAAPVDEPLHTQTGKHRFGLLTVTLATGESSPAVGVFVPSVGWCVIADIGLRMLQPRELARAQGFPDDYKLTGPKSNQVAKIGNSVPPPLVARIVAANIVKHKRKVS
jgi:site-specific DNA-cytosine methylase